jgi:hypothetical protein
MKKLYAVVSLCSFFLGYSQINLNSPETKSRTVTDPVSITLSQGFRATSSEVEFTARIQDSNPSNPPSSGGGGASPVNPSTPSGTLGSNLFHDTQGNIEVNGTGQLQFTLPIALPPGVKSVAPQVNLVYTSGSGNGIAGYGWNLSGITSIARVGKNIDKDGKAEGISLTYNDYYSFNGQRLILKSGEYGKDGSEYVTEKFSNVKIKAKGNLSGKAWKGPEYWEITFEDGSQAWYGNAAESRTPIEYNISKWKDAQGNYIVYRYIQSENVSVIYSIEWGGNEALGKPHFNKMTFQYAERDLKESSFVAGEEFIQNKILTSVQVDASDKQFKKYVINYHNGENGTKYQFVNNITEYNSNNEPSNPVIFEYQKSQNSGWSRSSFSDKDNKKLVGDFDGDGKLDFLKYYDAYEECVKKEKKLFEEEHYWTGKRTYYKEVCVETVKHPGGLYLFRGALDDAKQERIHIGNSDFSKLDFESNSLAVTLKDKDGRVKTSQGFVVYKKIPKNKTIDDFFGKESIHTQDIELQFYSIENNQIVKEYTKIISHKDYDRSTGSREYRIPGAPKGMVNGGYTRTSLGEVKSLDLDGDGISELVWNFPDEQCYFTPIKDGNGDKFPISSIDDVEDIGSYKKECHFYNRYMVINTASELSSEQSLSGFSSYGNKKIDDYKIGDFDGDGKMDFIAFDSDGRPNIIKTEKKSDTQRFVSTYKNFYKEQKGLDGLTSHAFTGDFNGDGKTDLLIPAGISTYDWKLYLSTGTEFKEENNIKIPYQPNPFHYDESGRVFYYGRHYFVQDINGDGKADFVVVGTYSRQNIYSENHYSKFIIKYYENIGVNENGKIDFEQKNIDGHTNINNNDSYTQGLICYPFIFTNSEGKFEQSIPSPDGHISTPHKFGALSPMVGSHYINNSNYQILLMHQEGGVMVKFSSYELNKASRISAITQGELRTEVDYKELDPISTKDPHFYAPVKQEKYPYMELEKVSQSYAVSQLRQIISLSQTRKQDFRYRGFVTHLQGKGMIGFRKTARSSWYADGFENTKVWSGVEIDPLNEGLPIKEWSIKTNDETQIFPKDVSLNNQSLLSFKSTQYKVDKLVNGVKVSTLSQEDKPKAVTAIVPTEVTTKDFIKETTSIDRVEYNELYLPVKTISSTNNGFAEKTTQIEYYPANLSAEGKDYSVGRPRVKTELVRAYGDSKGAKEEYHYENNLLKSLTTYNRDNSGWLKESYEYDGFGNITTKTISNSVDSNTQTSKTEYEDKGRFVIKKTDNLDLITLITYNDWGQVLTQKDPLGNTLTNTYDSWGKLLSVSTNLGGTKTITYQKFGDHEDITTEYFPDGKKELTITNKIGQTYKSTTNLFGRNVTKEVHYDALGRKIKESEAYSAALFSPKWNTIEYDEYSRPIKATAFTGKIVETKYTKNTVTVTETNANNRFKKQTFDALGNITSTEDKGGIIEFKYNAAGEVIEAKYGTNIVTTKYDAWGRKIEYHDPSNGLYKYEYHHGFGLLTKEISPKGFKEYTYNDKGQLISQKEKSNKQGVTDKEIHFAYNDKGMLLSKTGSSKGKAFSSHIAYDKYGRVIAASEESFGKKYERKNVVYDPIGRVHSYEKSLTSSGKTTHVVIENVYDSSSGTMYQLKDKSSGKVLWELEKLTAKGKVLKAKLGGTSIQNTYDANDFLSAVSHKAEGKPDILSIAYSFNAIKNELNSRNTSGAFNILERFVYDDNNRLINWTNPRTGELHHNVYDKQGRIIENDQLGKIKFENKDKVYQSTGMSLNEKGAELLKNNLIQKIEYNENNDPVFIDGVKGDVRFEYGLTAMRQMMTFGGEFLSENASQNETSHGKFTRFYSEDGSFEVTLDHQSGKEKHILYIGGNPYESEIIFVKDFKEEKGSYKFLHKDYLGSILAISDEEGNKLEQRHYDAWGNLTHLQIGNGEVITDPEQIAKAQLLLDRGYTSHEHLWEVGIIHMNGRLYDPLLRRFLNADENIQDLHNTQNYNKYGYVFNNPLMYNDPSGEFIGVVLAIVTSKLFIVGAAVGAATYLITSAIKGTPITLKGFLGSAIKTGLSFYLGGLMNPEAFSLSMGELLLRGADHVVASILPSLDINIGDFSFSISPSIAIGKGWGFGANVSASFHIGDFTISRGFGIMNYGYHAGSGEKGWEYRNSEMFTYDDGKFGVSLGTNIWSGLHEQQTGIIGLRHGDFSMSYENDGAPFGHTLGDNNDSYRTAAMRFGIGDFSAGFNLFTGVRLESSYEDKGGADKYTMEKYSSNRKKGFFNRLFSPIPIGEVINGVNYPFGLVQEIGTKYRLGAAYIGWRNYRVGIDSDRHVRYPIQVIGAHYFASPQPGQQVIQNKPEEIIKYYFQYHTKNKFTSW